MTLRNTAKSWGTISKVFHWTIVALIIIQYIIAQQAEALPLGMAKLEKYAWHKSFGMTILMLAVLRLIWRWMNPTPALDTVTRPWERWLANFSHLALYGLIFAIPLTGWMMSSARNFPVSWFGVFQFPDLVAADQQTYNLMNFAHEWLFNILAAVALLHIAGALKHHFIDRNDVLRRMLPFSKSRDS